VFEQDLKAQVGLKAITEVTTDDLCAIVRNKYERLVARPHGKGVGANRLHTSLTTFFKWCRKDGRSKLTSKLTQNPMGDMPKALKKEKPRDRWLKQKEIEWLFRSLELMCTGRWNDESEVHARAIELLLLLIARRGEIYLKRRDCIQGDRLVVPKTKNTTPNLLWLSPSAIALIGDDPNAGPQSRVFGVIAEATGKPVHRLRTATSWWRNMTGAAPCCAVTPMASASTIRFCGTKAPASPIAAASTPTIRAR
jgi:integrase